MLHASASGRSTFHSGTGRVPPAHKPKQATVQQAGAACPEWARRSCLQLQCPHLRQTRSDGTARTIFPEPHYPVLIVQTHPPNYISRATFPEPRLSVIFPEPHPRATSFSHISRAHLPNYIPRTTEERYPVKTPKLKPPSKTPCLTFHQRPQIPSRLRILNAPSSIPRTDVGSRCERTSNSAANGHRKPSNDPPPLFHTPSTFRQALPPIVPGNRTSNHSTLLRRWMRPLRRCPAATSSQRYGGRLLPHSIFRIFDRR